uniref:NADH-ubiquinone oxidoreductase chain 4L n=1 Tax=Siphonosoma cumanense TaxID=6444 RepID=A0A7D4VGM3_SIPCU|nr:NADH dehydrogenase subunit 4L [Siphonosoma cumanense]QKS32599.1 NADH dehydrogenase subunit 4L [Siphonosoma cumanense]
MFFSMNLFTILFPISSTLSLLAHRRQFLMALLFLEALALSLATLASFSTYSNLFMILIILTFAACEASLGLALLVVMTRSFGSDLLLNLTNNKW